MSWGFFSWYDKRTCRGTTTQDKGFFLITNKKCKVQFIIYTEGWVMELQSVCPWITGQKYEGDGTPPLFPYTVHMY